jgi:7-cyano-7-deazaguanine synthase in queuosine biosynthesis
MSKFYFESYEFDEETYTAHFHYSFDDGWQFVEAVRFERGVAYDEQALERALFLSFILVGTSYFKTFPTSTVELHMGSIDEWQATFFNKVYQEGLSQFAFENQLTRDDLAHFVAHTTQPTDDYVYRGEGTFVLQSGGKDSLLLATLLAEKNHEFTPWYLRNSEHHPAVLDDLSYPLATSLRLIDVLALKQSLDDGAKNGHVPVTYIVQSLALVQAILLNKNEVVVAIAHEGEEPHARIGDLSVTHQWSKTWEAEQLFAQYVSRYISNNLRVGSPLRSMSELRVAELFITHAWEKFGHRFSSCNRANYKQGDNNSELHWCGECPKCANSFLLFAPFLDADALKALFAGQDLFAKPLLLETFKGLLGIDGVMKPFECVGEIDELRFAYHQAQKRGGYQLLPFNVPEATFDYMHEYPAQDWALEVLQ